MQFKNTIYPQFPFYFKFNTQCYGMGKTSLANTFAEFLKSPTERSMPVLTKGTDLEFTKVMQLYDGLSINQNREISVQVEDLPRNGSVKLVKLQMDRDEENSPSEPKKEGKRKRFKKMFNSWFTRAPDETIDEKSPIRSEDDKKNDVQLKLVDMGGHSVTMVLTSAVNSKYFYFHENYIQRKGRD